MNNQFMKVDFQNWFKETKGKMNNSTEKSVWKNNWENIGKELGVNPSSREKCCPRLAAYAIWYYLLLNHTKISGGIIEKCREEVGKNGTYALIAIKLINSKKGDIKWESVRKEFNNLFDEEAAQTDQGALRIAKILIDNYKF